LFFPALLNEEDKFYWDQNILLSECNVPTTQFAITLSSTSVVSSDIQISLSATELRIWRIILL